MKKIIIGIGIIGIISICGYLFVSMNENKLNASENVGEVEKEKEKEKDEKEYNLITTSVTETKETTFSVKADISQLKQVQGKVFYKVWRTADKEEQGKWYEGGDSLIINTSDFDNQKGEYTVQGYIEENGTKKKIGSTTTTVIQQVPILMYHAISPPPANATYKSLFVPVERFEEQMQYLKSSGFTPIGFEELEHAGRYNKPILVTLDDGYADNINVYHTLKKLTDEKFKPKATVFMIAGSIDGANSLKTEQIKEMADSGMISFQSHTFTHPDLRIPTTNYEQEFKGSKDKIAAITGKEPLALAYPEGKYNEKVVEEAKKYYKYAVTIKQGKHVKDGEGNGSYEMKRVRVSHDTSMNQFKEIVK